MTTVQERLGDYEGLVEIARGGFATVYRAWQPAFEREVAIKVISGSLDQASFDRFARECVAIGALSGHPNIVTVYDVDASDKRRPSIVMEMLDGGSLADLVETKGTLDWAQVLGIGIRLAGALESAHRASVLHLDVKPENVLLSRFGEPKLTDFGIARVQGTGDTGSGVVWATLAHAAPEVVAGSRPTVAADVYSLASTLHHLLSGRPPFVCAGDAGIVPLVVRIANEDPPDLREHGVPDGFCRVLERAMAKDLGDRPLSAAQLGRQLQAVEVGAGLPITPMPLESEDAPRRPPRAGLSDAGPGSTVPGRETAGTGRARRRWSRLAQVAGAVCVVVAAVGMLLPRPGHGTVRLTPVFADDFATGAGWYQQDDALATFGYESGRYRIALREARRQAISDTAATGPGAGRGLTELGDVSARVSVTPVSGTGLFGLVCRRTAGGDAFYEGLIGVDRSVRIVKYDGGSFVTLARVEGSPLDPTRPVRVRLDCVGPPAETRLALFVDNRQMATAVDSAGLLPGAAGVVLASAEAPSAEVRFDDFAVLGRSAG